VYEGEQRCDVHPLKSLLENPNHTMTWPSFMETLVSHLLLSGNAYVELLRDQEGILGMDLIRPDRVKILAQGGHVVAYEVSEENRKRRVMADLLSPSIVHLKLFHPLNDWYGMSPIEAASRAIDQHNAVSSHNVALLQNGGRPSGALRVRGDIPLSDDQRESLRSEMRSAFQGGQNAGQVLVMEGDLEWKELDSVVMS